MLSDWLVPLPFSAKTNDRMCEFHGVRAVRRACETGLKYLCAYGLPGDLVKMQILGYRMHTF